MKEKTIKLTILILVVLIFFLFLLKMSSIREGGVKEVGPRRPSPAPVEREIGVKVWLEKKTPDHFLLVGDSDKTEYDTFQLVFNTKTEILKDFLPSDVSDFSLRVKSFKGKEAILLFSTEGELRRLDPDKPLGELLLFPRADISDLIVDQNRTKIVKRGENFSVRFEGIKSE